MLSKHYILSLFLLFVLLCILTDCLRHHNAIETVYDLPRENLDIKYSGLEAKDERDTIKIYYNLYPAHDKPSGLYLRSQYHYYFLESIGQGNGHYMALFSKKLLKSGVYEIGICPDTSSPEVIFSEHYLTSTLIPEHVFSVFSDQLLYSIEKFKSDSSKIRVQGWAYVKNQSMDYHIINIGLVQNSTGFFYETELQTRKDVTSYFKPGFNVDYSGFWGVIPTGGLPKGAYNVAVKITNLVDSTSYVSISDKFVILPQRLDSIPLETGNLSYNIENIDTSSEVLHIRGWAYLNGKSANHSQIYLLFKSEIIFAVKVNVLERRDVTSYFKSPINIDHSGFDLQLDQSLLKEKNYKLGILIVNDGDYGVAYLNNTLNLNF